MTSGPDGPYDGEGSGRRSAFGLLNLALDNLALVLAVPIAVALLALLLATLRGPEYAADSTFVPESRSRSVGELGGLAAQLGLGAGLMNQDESVDFYAALARSRALLEDVARQSYRVGPDDEGAAGGDGAALTGTIPDLFGIEGDSPEERLRIAVEVLRELVQVEADRSAGMVHVRTLAPWRDLAVQLNRATLDAVSRFNLEKRQSSAAAERAFAEEQLARTRADLEEAEAELQRFLEANRRYEGLPELRFEADRLERRVLLVQQLYTSLAQSLQNARLEEVRATPTITVISPPENSAIQTTSPVRTAVLGFLVGLALAIAYLYLHEYVARQRRRAPDEFAEFQARRRRLLRRRAT